MKKHNIIRYCPDRSVWYDWKGLPVLKGSEVPINTKTPESSICFTVDGVNYIGYSDHTSVVWIITKG